MHPINLYDPVIAGTLKVILIGTWGIASFIIITLAAELARPRTNWAKLKIVVSSFIMGLGAPAIVALMIGLYNFFTK